MIPLSRWPVFALLVVVSSATRVPDLPSVHPNPNLKPAGVLHDGVLTVALEAKYSVWHLDGPNRPSTTIEAFSEPGQPPLLPGPLVRVPRGTEIRLSVKNSLPRPLTFFLPAAIHGGPDKLAAMDSLVIAPGAVGVLTTPASVPGNYVYRATTPTGASKVWRMAGLLAGGVVVDPSTAAAPPRDRVFVIMLGMDSAFTADVNAANGLLKQIPPGVHIVYTINGASWPNTERIAATVGDSLHWRVINATFDVHPMHLHGFYFRVDTYSGPFADGQGPLTPGQMVVTQLMGPFSAMSVSWLAERPGNWLFHCHFAFHLQPDSHSAAPDDPDHRDMTGLALGVRVAGRPAARVPDQPKDVRHLRLIAVADSTDQRVGHRDGGQNALLHFLAADSVPSMRFILEDHGHRSDPERDLSPEIDLTKGVPVAITIVNHLSEPTSVHWHGIEIEDSYVDGVPGFSGTGRHLTPAIAPGDSFEARFTPPRAGTFMYHAHVDEVREQLGGLEGALIVRDSGDTQLTDDHVFFLKGLGQNPAHPLEINGATHPDTVVLHVGRRARFRFLNLSTTAVVPSFGLTARRDTAVAGKDTMAVIWRPVAKDGFDLPAAAQTPRSAHQIVSMGETYDFEYTPQLPGVLYLEVRGGSLLEIRVPIRVE